MGYRTLVLAGFAGWASAATAAPWTGEAELGVVATTGNTETTSINARAKVIGQTEKWRHTLKAEALNTSDEDATTAERYLLSGKTDYSLGARHYVFGTLMYESDRFSGFDWRTTEIAGYGRHVIQEADLALDLEGGIGARQSRIGVTEDTENEWLARVAGDLKWKISPTSTFTETLTIDVGEDATITKSITAITAQVVGSLAMRVGYTIMHTSSVPPGVEETDTEAAATLVYSF